MRTGLLPILFLLLIPGGGGVYSQTAVAGPAATCPILKKEKSIISNRLTKAVGTLLKDSAGVGSNAKYSGAVALVVYKGNVIYHQAVGQAQQMWLDEKGRLVEHESPRLMQPDTLFDLASVTKVAATTTALMRLVSEGQLSLDDTLGEHLPEMVGTDKADITLRQLLTHRSGLWQWQPSWLFLNEQKPDVVDYLAGLPRRYPIGERRAYSDFGFILLGKVIERVTAVTLDQYVSRHIYQPLGMADTQYRPPARLKQRIAATSHGNPFERKMIKTGKPYPMARPIPDEQEFDYRQYTLVGEANDGNAYYGLNGVAGHAGLFSTAGDLAILGQTLINGGCYGKARITDRETVKVFFQTPFDDNQAHGYWASTSPDGAKVYWHPGFTGTQFLIQPQDELVVILLTNRQHPALPDKTEGYPSVKPVWQAVLDRVYSVLALSENG
ncbi:serine hydrolase domain-containing protein [Saliniradius amylolyticus]|nr:serine hydrolase [Saliniradius amylolyticus]